MRPHTWFLLLALAVRWSPMARAGEPPAAEKLSALIDSRLAAGWAEAGVRRALPVDDASIPAPGLARPDRSDSHRGRGA